ncbi:hypothetical protein A1O7_03952 [Cladophialophora yegresii CBS 114405]|uniref:Uncharacterized protein n=1 Tax=Cladophialophora yegresii CBS 114405 TaxID=1182544 RepID=W9W459_9EURO|nr:uncharacterized protein A1O7_03952 [Cladophialophora yegresii CBS 114405]EXJ59805.1 hypothetical protein A1O7_03952 [Cladophialophora yegresii CBS 114405]
MCYTYVTRPYCPCCRVFVKNVNEEDIKEKICPIHAPCKVRQRRPLRRSPRVDVVGTVCADCTWKGARALFARSTAAERHRTTFPPPEEVSPVPNPIGANGSYVGGHVEEIHVDTLTLEDGADFEAQGASYLGTELMKELGEQEMQPTYPARRHSGALSTALSSSSDSIQGSSHCCSVPKRDSAHIGSVPMGLGVPGAPTMPRADRLRLAAAAAAWAALAKSSPSPPRNAGSRRHSRPYDPATPPRPRSYHQPQRQSMGPPAHGGAHKRENVARK